MFAQTPYTSPPPATVSFTGTVELSSPQVIYSTDLGASQTRRLIIQNGVAISVMSQNSPGGTAGQESESFNVGSNLFSGLSSAFTGFEYELSSTNGGTFSSYSGTFTLNGIAIPINLSLLGSGTTGVYIPFSSSSDQYTSTGSVRFQATSNFPSSGLSFVERGVTLIVPEPSTIGIMGMGTILLITSWRLRCRARPR